MASFADSGTRPKIHADLHPKIHADLRAVAVFFHQEYDDCLDPRVVDECLDQVAARFAHATVRSFVPLLVTRYVRDELQARLGQT